MPANRSFSSNSERNNRGNRSNRPHGSGNGRRANDSSRGGSANRGHGGKGRARDQRKNSYKNNGDDFSSRRTGPQKSGYREQRLARRSNDPDIPADISEKDLDPTVRQDLRSLSKANADAAARHMVAAAVLMDEDPQLALRHARAAKERAGRVAVARETCGIAAYRAGEWKEALAELRAARRMSGGPGLVAVMADCERGLGQPEKAIELSYSEEAEQLDPVSKEELAIVVAGARRDLGRIEEAIHGLELENLSPSRQDPEASRLFYAYADMLADAHRTDEAIVWFEHAASHDPDEILDSAQRIHELKQG